MQSVELLMTTKVPVTFLTATLPIRLENKLKEVLRIPDEHEMIRTDTNRLEHQYIIFRSNSKKLLHHAVAFIILSSRLYLSGQKRGIIFVRSKEMGQSIVELFPQMAFINADVTDEGIRASAFDDWKNGRSGGWIVGTTSLIQGVDYHNVHFVLFVATPFSMFDFVQGAGRAGRNGETSAVVVLDSGIPFPPSRNDVEDLSCRQEMVDWTNAVGKCRRLGISSCMDRDKVECHSIPGAIPCDMCNPRHHLMAVWSQINRTNYDEKNTLQKLSANPLMGMGFKPTQLEMASLVPQLASPAVIKHSLIQMGLMHARTQTALECIRLLEDFSPDCAICHAESGGSKRTGGQHKTWKECTVGEHFVSFYDWNKPSKVRGSAQIIIILC